METILLTNKYTGTPLDIVRDEVPEGFEILFLPEQTQDALSDLAPEADYILAGGRLKITEDVIKRANKLRMIQRSGVGLDALDLDAIRKRGIPLYVNQGINAESVAEHTLLLMLGCLRRLPQIDRNTKNGIWKKQEQGVQTAELKGKTVGIIGMGKIARRLVDLLQPFRVDILYFNRTRMSEAYEAENNMRYVDCEELLSLSDIVTLHCALTPQTKGLIGKNALDKMRNGAILINTARGELVDSQALADALKSERLSFAGIDVHVPEPVSADYPLKDLDNVILTPHIAGVTADSFRAMMHDAFQNIDYFDKKRFEEIELHRYL